MEIVAFESQSVGATSSLEPSWRAALKTAVRDPQELCQILGLLGESVEAARQAAQEFPLFVPRSYISRMQPGNPNDPLLLQVLPLRDESEITDGFTADPVGDSYAKVLPGLLQKYSNRVLLITTGACAIHCRYCFRRHFPYSEGPHSISQWQPALQAIRSDSTIQEVILSGGDPLTLADSFLEALSAQIAEIPHVRRLRIHTRLPVIIPERVTDDLLFGLRATRLTPIVVIHANHAAELDDQVATAITRIVDAGIVVLNQAVLLRRVNDSLESLENLCERLVDLRVMPYYLHQVDRVAGAAHFYVPIAVGRELINQLRKVLPGYAVPRYVVETAGEAFKVPL